MEIHNQKEKQYNETIASIYELLCNLLPDKAQSQWNCILQEIHDRDSWAGVEEKRHK
jgi:hypothetical protein